MKSPAYLPAFIRAAEPLAARTTFGIGGEAAYYAEVADTDTLLAALDWARRAECPVYPLGGGSNILVADDGVEALVVRLERTGEFGRLEFSEADGCRVVAAAAVKTAELVEEAARRGYSGLEFLAGIPGTVGGAVATNAGGRAGRVEEVLAGFDGLALDAADHEVYRLTRSRDAETFMVLRAEFRLAKSTPGKVRERVREVLEHRRLTQPEGAASAGCIFRNPPGTDKSAGELIEAAGLKGASRGGARVSTKHANWILNTGGATALDVASLAVSVVARVREAFGVQLAFEIDLWGESLEEYLLREGYLV